MLNVTLLEHVSENCLKFCENQIPAESQTGGGVRGNDALRREGGGGEIPGGEGAAQGQGAAQDASRAVLEIGRHHRAHDHSPVVSSKVLYFPGGTLQSRLM